MTDIMGSTIGLLTQDGRIFARYHYDEFGMVLDSKKFDVNWPGPDNLYGYTGLEYDYYTDLNYARARYYKPEIGRFISEDTYKGTLRNTQSQNLYTYVYNNPLIYTDPSGYDAIIITARWAAKWQGHTSMLVEDAAGDWYYTYWGDKAVIVEKVDSEALNSLRDFNVWNDNLDRGGRNDNTTNYTSSTYIQGDFTESLATFNAHKERYDNYFGGGGNKNGDYKLIKCNCATQSFDALLDGEFYDGTSMRDYIGDTVFSFRPNTARGEYASIFMNSAFTLEGYIAQLDRKRDQVNRRMGELTTNYMYPLLLQLQNDTNNRINTLLSEKP
jgi:RHS repeat-associated protein